MVKILRRRNPDDNDPKIRCTCTHCRSWLEFKKSEARHINDRGDNVMVIRCPVCKQDVWVTAKGR